MSPSPIGAYEAARQAAPEMKLPELPVRVSLKRKRLRTGYAPLRVTKATLALLRKIQAEFDEPLDSIIFYMAAKELGHDYAALLSILDRAIMEQRRGCAPAANGRWPQ